MPNWEEIAAAIGKAGGIPFSLDRRHAAGGGCINTAHILEGSGLRYFAKLNSASKLDMFVAEAEGLREILESRSIRVPSPLCHGISGSDAFLVLEYIDLGGRGSAERLGRELAAMHHTTNERHGWKRDNTIGATPQHNDWHSDWIEFWRERRLHFQLDLAVKHGGGRGLQAKGERLLNALPSLLASHIPAPSLLHGDLWGGNYGFSAEGEPVIFDPAVYFGDREADIAMTELFGGFPAAFYSAYQEVFPLDPGYPKRKILYNLYHVLNHYNLFGGSYRHQAESMIEQLLAEIG
jgi:protein-ribulosamine 3-kinase